VLLTGLGRGLGARGARGGPGEPLSINQSPRQTLFLAIPEPQNNYIIDNAGIIPEGKNDLIGVI